MRPSHTCNYFIGIISTATRSLDALSLDLIDRKRAENSKRSAATCVRFVLVEKNCRRRSSINNESRKQITPSYDSDRHNEEAATKSGEEKRQMQH